MGNKKRSSIRIAKARLPSAFSGEHMSKKLDWGGSRKVGRRARGEMKRGREEDRGRLSVDAVDDMRNRPM